MFGKLKTKLHRRRGPSISAPVPGSFSHVSALPEAWTPPSLSSRSAHRRGWAELGAAYEARAHHSPASSISSISSSSCSSSSDSAASHSNTITRPERSTSLQKADATLAQHNVQHHRTTSWEVLEELIGAHDNSDAASISSIVTDYEEGEQFAIQRVDRRVVGRLRAVKRCASV